MQPGAKISDFETDLATRILEAHRRFSEAIEKGDKDYLKDRYLAIRKSVDGSAHSQAMAEFHTLSKYFSDGKTLNPKKIKPILVEVSSNSHEERLFRLVRRTWTIPFSKGYGRRLRFLVINEADDTVIGIIGLQSPPADLACRDNLFHFPEGRKLELLNQTMDVFSLGAIPPYSNLLAGKLVAGLVHSRKIRSLYEKTYSKKETILRNAVLPKRLVAATTTSAFGRSSVYNRLRFHERLLAEPIGYTQGFGLIHLEELYPELVELLKIRKIDTSGGFGKGPKHRWQIASKAIHALGLPSQLLQHGLKRQTFLFNFSENLKAGMSGSNFGREIHFDEKEYCNFWMDRWMLPRMVRETTWKSFDAHQYFSAIFRTVNP